MPVNPLAATSITSSGDAGTGAYAEFQTGELIIAGVYIVAAAKFESLIAVNQSKANRIQYIPYLLSVKDHGALLSGKVQGEIGYNNGYMIFTGADRFRNIPILNPGAVVKLLVYLPDIVGNLLPDGFNDSSVNPAFSIKMGTSLLTVRE